MEIRPVEAKSFSTGRHMDGRTDMTKLIVSFRNFAIAPKNEHFSQVTNYPHSNENLQGGENHPLL
jgi:hypothetical protein